MSEFKGTTGGWELKSPNDIMLNKRLIACSLGEYVSGVYTHTEECKANAKLIACAPEMLEIIKKFLIEFEYEDATESECILYHEAKQLIKKATE